MIVARGEDEGNRRRKREAEDGEQDEQGDREGEGLPAHQVRAEDRVEVVCWIAGWPVTNPGPVLPLQTVPDRLRVPLGVPQVEVRVQIRPEDAGPRANLARVARRYDS